MKDSRKRPRKLSIGKNTRIPPTATRVRLEAILDEKPKKKKKFEGTKVAKLNQNGAVNPIRDLHVAATSTMWSRVVQRANNKREGGKTTLKSVPLLLADAPGYRMAKMTTEKRKSAIKKMKRKVKREQNFIFNENRIVPSTEEASSLLSGENLAPGGNNATKSLDASKAGCGVDVFNSPASSSGCATLPPYESRRFVKCKKDIGGREVGRTGVGSSFRVGLKLARGGTKKRCNDPRLPPPQKIKLSDTTAENVDGIGDSPSSIGFRDEDDGNNSIANNQKVTQPDLVETVQKSMQFSCVSKDRSIGSLFKRDPDRGSGKSTFETTSLAEVPGSFQACPSSSSANALQKRQKQPNNDNFVRQNLRNSAGSCRGARNRRRQTKMSHWNKDLHEENERSGKGDQDVGNITQERKPTMRKSASDGYGVPIASRLTGLDPLDDYLDGMFEPQQERQFQQKTVRKGDPQRQHAPKCPRHQRPCKLLKVKKSTTGNKGRSFFACSMPRGEQCDYFQWADDTVQVCLLSSISSSRDANNICFAHSIIYDFFFLCFDFQAARSALLKNTSHSAFLARQVATHVERFKLLTVPELRKEASRRSLNQAGKKQQLLTRLAIWVRDQVAKEQGGTQSNGKSDVCKDNDDGVIFEFTDEGSCSDDSDEETVSSEELELCDEGFGRGVMSSFDKDEPHHRESNDGQDKEPILHNLPAGTSKMAKSTNGPAIDRSEVYSTLRSVFGHDDLRDGQEWAINRCLDRKRTLLVAPTGFGKSLCYALPATLMDGICVVVTPLLSLIQVCLAVFFKLSDQHQAHSHFLFGCFLISGPTSITASFNTRSYTFGFIIGSCDGSDR